jgi:hypothetical protein
MSNDTLYKQIDFLTDKYSNNDYILSKLNHYILNVLPDILDDAHQTNIQRIERKNKLLENSDIFVEKFLRVNKYFYCPRNELFMLYDDTHFTGYSEDDIQHQILTKITNEQTLVPWKHKMKQHIIKRIKERNPINVIPESNTIQFVLKQIYPSIFSSRNSAKHFLTALGDNIKNKKISKQLIYIVPPQLKEFIREIEYQYYTYFGHSGLLNNFKYKYYEHDYNICRFISLQKSEIQFSINHILSKNIMDLFCVASHYSERYGSADSFIERINDNHLTNYVGFLKNKTPDTLVIHFIEKALQRSNHCIIKTNSMIYVWKKYLQEQNIPNIIFYDTLINLFKQYIEYDEKTDTFKNVTSIHLPFVTQFTNFWDTYIQEDETAPELEIDELLYIIKRHNNKIYNQLNYELVIELLHNLYPDIVIEENKYIMNIYCKLWDKKEEVKSFLAGFSEHNTNRPNSIQEIYHLYVSENSFEHQYRKDKSDIKISKRCFEKILIEILGNHVDADGEINEKYWC